MSVTAHYLTPDFSMEVKCLNVQYFPDNHTASHIAVALEESINYELNQTRAMPVKRLLVLDKVRQKNHLACRYLL